MALLEVRAISKSYPSSSGAALVVDQVSFTIARGETLVLDDQCQVRNDPDREARKVLPST